MYRIIDNRGTGKTSRLLLLAKENNGVVVCFNPQRLIEKSHIYGITGIKFMSYAEFISGVEQVSGPIYIDDLEFLASYITKRNFTSNLEGYTLSTED